MRNRWHELTHSQRRPRAGAATTPTSTTRSTPEFYKLWLDDPLMLYTCAYWTDGTRTLEEAQRNKCDHVARKLLLKPGEEVVDVGSGFGGFMFHAQERYGVKVTGDQHHRLAGRARAPRDRAPAPGQRALDADARAISATPAAQFDKVASIGCLEHAGRDQLGELIRAHARYLKKGGLGLIHFIGHVGRFDTDFFIRKYVFPGGWIPSLADVIVEMEKAGLEVLDIENLRRHYALTLDVWAERFDRNWERIRALDPQRFDERFRRIWRVYLYGCAEMFRSPDGRTHLFQIVFSQGQRHAPSYPMSRDFLYERRSRPPARRAASGMADALAAHAAKRDSLARSSAASRGRAGRARQGHLEPVSRPRGGRAPPARRARASIRSCGIARRLRRRRRHDPVRGPDARMPRARRDAGGRAAAEDDHARRRGRRRRHRVLVAPPRPGARHACSSSTCCSATAAS